MTAIAESEVVSSPPERVARLKHPRATRWMHWINFPLLTIMIWSGLRIYWANSVYRIGFGDAVLFEFFPDGFNEKLDLDRHLARGMAFHFTFGWLFAINGLAFGAFLAKSGEWRHLIPDPQGLRRIGAVILHDLHLRKEAPPQPGRYNAAQQVAYSGVLILGALALLSGLAIYKPIQLSPLTWAFGGYETARAVHFIVTIAFLVFFAVHLLQVMRAGFSNFFSMVTGYELEKKGSTK